MFHCQNILKKLRNRQGQLQSLFYFGQIFSHCYYKNLLPQDFNLVSIPLGITKCLLSKLQYYSRYKSFQRLRILMSLAMLSFVFRLILAKARGMYVMGCAIVVLNTNFSQVSWAVIRGSRCFIKLMFLRIILAEAHDIYVLIYVKCYSQIILAKAQGMYLWGCVKN